jgi:FKBP-type peptidyl-prolyl cis-trans isomerase
VRNATSIGIAILAATTGLAIAADTLGLDSETARINYSLGYQIGGDIRRQGIEPDHAALLKGIEDAVSGSGPLMKPEEMRSTLNDLRRRIAEEQKRKAAEQELKVAEEGRRFLEENAKKPGVVTTESGLQYQIVEPGTGKTPGPTDQVTVHYRGTQVDGEEFDSSYSRGKPATFQLNGVVKGWTEGLQLIKEGGKIKLFIPSKLAYGERGPLARRTLVFDVELISVGAPAAESKSPGAAQPSAAQ